MTKEYDMDEHIKNAQEIQKLVKKAIKITKRYHWWKVESYLDEALDTLEYEADLDILKSQGKIK
jgi:hypothetical protein